jgi:uncharacterized protein with PIN domain
LKSLLAPFIRCLECNGRLGEIPEYVAKRQVPESVADRHDHFTTCLDCGRIYWPGSHHDRMSRIVQEVAAELQVEPPSD